MAETDKIRELMETLDFIEFSIVPSVRVYIFLTPLPRAGCDISLIYKRNTYRLNLNFTFSNVGCLTEVKEPSILFSY